VPGIERQPLKKLAVDESALLKLLHRWREEAEKAGSRIERIVVAFEAGRDGRLPGRALAAHPNQQSPRAHFAGDQATHAGRRLVPRRTIGAQSRCRQDYAISRNGMVDQTLFEYRAITA
jgi:hypothetical protein